MKIIIVGAGLAGLACGQTLQKAGVEVLLLEKYDAPGGRVRTDYKEGYTLDRGFQTLFTAYPMARRFFNYETLDLRAFDPGAVVCQGTHRHLLTDPLRDTAPSALLPAFLSNLIPFSDKLRTLRLSSELRALTIQSLNDGPDETTRHYIRRKGFSEAFTNDFLAPFFSGIFLENQLSTSARIFRFYWKMLSEGETAVPAGGISQLANSLAANLPIQYNTPIKSLLLSKKNTKSAMESAMVGVKTEEGETFKADTVVLATDAWQTASLAKSLSELSELPLTYQSVGVTTLYFAGDAPLVQSKKIILNANQQPWLSNIAPVTNVAPEYAPAGKHLIAANHLGVSDTVNVTDDVLYDKARTEMQRLFTGDRRAESALRTYQPIALYRIAHAQFAQPSGILEQLPSNQTKIPQLYIAGELTRGSSINGALESGEKAAKAILEKK